MSDPILELRRKALEQAALTEQHLGEANAAAIRSGTALLEARRQVPAEEWEQWLRDHFKGSPEDAARYMQLAAESAP